MDEISQNVRGEQEQENPGQNEGQGQNQGQGEGQNQGQNQFVIERSPSPDWEDADFNVNFEVDFTKKFLNVAKSYRVIPTRVSDDYSSEFEKLKSFLLPKIETYLEEELSIKLHLTLLCLLHFILIYFTILCFVLFCLPYLFILQYTQQFIPLFI